MTRRVAATFLKFVLAVYAACAQAQQDDGQIVEMMELTGFGKLVNLVPRFADVALERSKSALDEPLSAGLQAVFPQAYRTDLVYQSVLESMRAQYHAEQATAYLQILRSPLARKMAELERGGEEQAVDLKAFAEQLRETPPDAKRVALIKRLDVASRTTAFTVDMQAAFYRDIFHAADLFVEPKMRMATDELEAMVDEIKRTLEGPAADLTTVSYLFAYKGVPDPELTRYVEMIETPAFRWGVGVLGEAMMSALAAAGERAAAMLPEAVQ